MKKLIIGAMLLALAVLAAGCNKTSSAAKKPDTKEKPAATSTAEHKTTKPAEHKTMKPVTPATSTEHNATMPEAMKPVAKPEAKAPATTETPKDNK